MNANSFLIADYLDILFNNRNKLYGGYELRKHYPKRVKKALLLVATLLSATVLIVMADKKPGVVPAVTHTAPTVMAELKLYTPPPAKPIEMPKSHAAPANTAAYTPPVIVKDNTDIKTMVAPVEDLANKVPGIGNTGSNITGDGGTNTETPGADRPAVAEPPAAPIRYVEQMPEFDGNFHNYLSRELRYPALAKENDIEGKVLVEFVVNEDGAISAARIVRGIGGGCDEEALRVIRNMPKWKPGRQNGRAVKVFFTLPIIFELQ